MTAETLREAASLIREDHPPCTCGETACPTIFFEATALLLENESHAWDLQEGRSDPDGFPDLSVNHARRSLLTDVARAYLEGPA